MWPAPNAPGRSSSTVSVRVSPDIVAIVTGTSRAANSAIFCRHPPQGGTGLGLPAMTASAAICVSPAATMAAMAPASAQVPSG